VPNIIGIGARGGRRLAATLFAASLGLLGASSAAAGSFQVNPVHIALAPDRAATSLTVKNDDREAVSVRVHTYRWTQDQGEDVYSATSDVIASPPIFTIPAGGTQLIRLGLRTRTAGAAYRVVLEEIPRKELSSSGIKVALRLNLPFYILNSGGKPDVRWTASRDNAGDVVIEAANRGSLHAQILEIDAIGPAGKETILSKTMGVVLPGSAKRWKIGRRPEFAIGAPLLLKIRGPSGVIQAKVVVEKR